MGNLRGARAIIRSIRSYSVSRVPVSLRFALALVVIGVATHWQWFIPGNQFRWGDDLGASSVALPQYGVSYVSWLSFSGLGGINIQPYQLMFFQSWRLLSILGANFPITEQLTMLWPIAILSFLSPYLFIRRLLRSNSGGFEAALVYGLSTSLLVYEGFEIFLALAFSLLPLVLFSMDVFLERRSWRSLLVFVLCFSALCSIDIRVAFLGSLLLLWFTLFSLTVSGRRLPNIWQILVGGGLLILLNIYWVVVAVGVSGATIASVTSRSVFGNSFTNLEHAVTLVNGAWVNGSIIVFSRGPISLVMWIIPILAIAGAFANCSKGLLPRWSVNLFAGAIALVGVMLAKQGNPPFSALYPWVYTHVPGFSLFRVGTDFFIIASLGYAILIGRLFTSVRWSVEGIKKMPYGTLCQIALAIALAFIIVPVVDGQVGGIFVHRSQPSGLQRVDTFIEAQKGFFRTLWLPDVPIWSSFSLYHPAVGAVTLLDKGEPLQYSVIPFGPVSVGMATVQHLGAAKGRRVLESYSVRYLVLPPSDSSNTSPLYFYYGEPRKFYLTWLEHQRWLKKIHGIGDGYSVYRVDSPKVSGLVTGLNTAKNKQTFMINSGLLVAATAREPRVGSTVSVSMLYNRSWRAYLVPLRELDSVCHVTDRRVNSCAVSSGLPLLLNSWLGGWQPIGAEIGPAGELKFRVTSASLANIKSARGTGPVGIVMVFGPAFAESILFLLAETIMGILIGLVLLLPMMRARWLKTEVDPGSCTSTYEVDLGSWTPS